MTDFALPATRYLLNGDVSIAYQVMGEKSIDIVLIPGAISHVEAMHDLAGYTAFLRRLAAFARVITFDKRGQGLSDRVTVAPSLEASMDDVRAVMDEVGSSRATVIGFSEGSAMSALFAATHPARVSRLILFGAFAKGGYHAAPVEDRIAVMLKHWGTGVFVKRAVAAQQQVSAEVLEAFGRFERLAASPGSQRNTMLVNRLLDVTPILGNVRVPTLVLHRKTDAIVDVEQGRNMAQLIPGARYIEYPDGDHGFWSGETEALLGDIEEFVTGQRDGGSADLERVLATVLFTDIAGSTQSAVELGDQRWRQRLDEHDRLARQVVERHRGNLVKTTGDGILATFDGPGRAVRCALAFAGAARDIGVPVRAGLHTGEIEMRGSDIGGIAVHAAARVMGQSQPGEVLVSRVVTDLVAGAGLRFSERGSHELKGIPGQWELFAASM
jgi:class 3 adenylate cyclase